ncbi:MAG TPA: glycosyltransferase [Nitratidesulfovibrio sp.]|nr:glycosyltransferase [Nitratidesulfovibrio sp.]
MNSSLLHDLDNAPLPCRATRDRHGHFHIHQILPSASCPHAVIPRVSVLLSVRNANNFLEAAIHSVLEQDMGELELLIADDGSNDDTFHRLAALAAQDSRIILVQQPNLGLTATLNRLFALSRGEFIARQDADDVWLPGKLRMQVDRMQADLSLVLLGTRFLIADTMGNRRPAPPHMDITGDAPLRDALACYNPFMHASVLMRGNSLRDCGGYNEMYDVAQDYELWLRLSTLGRIDVLDIPACVRHEDDTPITRRKASRQRRNVLRAKLHHRAWCKPWLSPLYFLLKDIVAAFLHDAVRSMIKIFFAHISKALQRTQDTGPDAVAKNTESHRTLSVLFCTARADWGGGPEHLCQLLRHLPDGVQAHVACPPHDEPYARRFADIVGAARCIPIPHRAFSPMAVLHMVRYIRTHHIDVLHSHGKGAGLYTRLAGLLSGRPCVHTFHGLHLDHYGRAARLAYALLERLLGSITARCITVSDSERQRVLAENFCPHDRIVTIPNGVVIPASPVHLASTAPFPVVHISRFDVAKNSGFIVDLLEELRRRDRHGEYRFIIVGEGEDRVPMQDALARNGLQDRVTFTGFHRNPAQYFEGALCYLSCSRWEGMPLSVMEALAHGLPVIASEVRGNVDVVRHGQNGLMYPLGNAAAAADALCALADGATLTRNLANAAREHARRNFDARIMANTTYSVLREVAHARKE